MVFVGVPAHALHIIVGHILIALALAAWRQAEPCVNQFDCLMPLKGMGTETAVGLDYAFALNALIVHPGHLNGRLFVVFGV
jgi:hypothetical protein